MVFASPLTLAPLPQGERELVTSPSPLEGEGWGERVGEAIPSPMIDPVALTQALIRCPSVTPADAGALGCAERRR